MSVLRGEDGGRMRTGRSQKAEGCRSKAELVEGACPFKAALSRKFWLGGVVAHNHRAPREKAREIVGVAVRDAWRRGWDWAQAEMVRPR